jgi:lipoprotein-releasing system permease protein
VKGISLVAPIVDGIALASSPLSATAILVRGIRADALTNLASIARNIRQGTLEGFDDGQGLAIGRRLAEQLKVNAGDRVKLVAPRGAVTPMGTTPRIKVYKVAAVFEIEMSEFDSNLVFMPLSEAQPFFNHSEDVTRIDIYTTNPDRIGEFRKAVTESAGRPISVVDWRQRNTTFFNALEVERNVMFLILTLIVLVAALNIISGLITLVKDKSSDIAILRTMGVSQGAIMRVFLITGSSIGVAGTLVGFLVGTLICLNIDSIRHLLSWMTGTELFPPELYFLSRLPAEMDLSETFSVIAMALTLSFLATLYPSWRAARLDPVEALRYG